jgi:hypothetical protein
MLEVTTWHLEYIRHTKTKIENAFRKDCLIRLISQTWIRVNQMLQKRLHISYSNILFYF